ncbi:dynamin family protein [Exiguobacterium undae]|uniref:dynamin family protein n=1 Tax=Exiguobacterium undae TaxID=169177 RepID=UPI00384FDF4A
MNKHTKQFFETWKTKETFASFLLQQAMDHAKKHPAIGIVGEFSSGKTSLIEALLDVKLGGVSILEATKSPVYYVYGETMQIIGFDSAQKQKVHRIDPAHFEKTILDAAIQFDWMLITSPHPALKNFSLIDTPGANGETAYQLRYLDMSIVLWCSAFGEPLTESQLNELKRFGNKPMFCAATKSDAIDEEEWEEAEEVFEETIRDCQAVEGAIISAHDMRSDAQKHEAFIRQLEQWTEKSTLPQTEKKLEVALAPYTALQIEREVEQKIISLNANPSLFTARFRMLSSEVAAFKGSYDSFFERVSHDTLYVWKDQSELKSIDTTYQEVRSGFERLKKELSTVKVDTGLEQICQERINKLDMLETTLVNFHQSDGSYMLNDVFVSSIQQKIHFERQVAQTALHTKVIKKQLSKMEKEVDRVNQWIQNLLNGQAIKQAYTILSIDRTDELQVTSTIDHSPQKVRDAAVEQYLATEKQIMELDTYTLSKLPAYLEELVQVGFTPSVYEQRDVAETRWKQSLIVLQELQLEKKNILMLNQRWSKELKDKNRLAISLKKEVKTARKSLLTIFKKTNEEMFIDYSTEMHRFKEEASLILEEIDDYMDYVLLESGEFVSPSLYKTTIPEAPFYQLKFYSRSIYEAYPTAVKAGGAVSALLFIISLFT